MKPLVIEPEAEEDIRSARDWYEAQREGLGEDFTLCLDACFGTVQQQPRSFQKVRKTARRALVHRFPYLVLFVAQRDAVIVIGVFHTSRDPASWDERLPD